jgi:hypothetical protein
MINWEELKHIHVIRKLEEILATWFNTEIFFVDERGQVRNYVTRSRLTCCRRTRAARL